MVILHGDCIEQIKTLADNSVDSIVTDPPAGISFMGKSWDSNKGGRDHWIAWMCEVATECKRVLKPGGHAFVWAIPRTSHWTATAWENAGFEIRDIVAHVFGSGFPKSHSIGKAVDKLQGNEREDLGEIEKLQSYGYEGNNVFGGDIDRQGKMKITKGTSEWEGWGTALKPAREDWLLLRKPLEKGLIIAENVLKWGTGGINIDESRVGTEDDFGRGGVREKTRGYVGIKSDETIPALPASPLGRFPANLITDGSEEVRECFPETKSVKANNVQRKDCPNTAMSGRNYARFNEEEGYNDSGNASRFFKSIPQGRFPANLLHDNSEEVRECFPETKPSKKSARGGTNPNPMDWGNGRTDGDIAKGHDDNGGNASRFFKSILYIPKASKSERNKGLNSYLTVKYNMPKAGGVLCKEENMAVVQLLEKVISDTETMSFSIGECGGGITGRCHRDSLSTTLTKIRQITESRILNSLTLLLTSESTADVNCEMGSGGSLVESVANLKEFLITITNGNLVLARGVSLAVSQMLVSISEEGQWSPSTNFHATVKPVALMEYLINMITPKGGIVLDPFAGSGTTGVAAINLGFDAILIEREAEYIQIINGRTTEALAEIKF